ncbi:MAG: class I SAM-dependent methyltransferase [Elusimicrobia bacterium]|nr:class I SAM-dependent methyltransferase [Elusimicrobiota bacterium]
MPIIADEYASQGPSFIADPRRCVVCGGTSLLKAFDSTEPAFAMLRCRDCGLGRTSPAPAPHEIARYYAESYYGKENVRFNPLFEAMTRWFQSRRAAVLHNRVARGPVLDVGCGRGFLLSYLRSLGYEPKGLEFSDTAAWHARNKLKLDVATQDFLSAPLEKESFNAVIFWHSLEHLPRPIEAMERAYELLRPGGMLAIAVPNSESLQARIFGRHWFHLDIPRHYFHFGTGSLDALLSRGRFRTVQRDHFSLEQNPYGWLQSLYNLMGFKNNFLYSLLKNSSARTIEIRGHLLQTALVLALLPPLLVLSLLMTLLEAGLRRGGTIEVYAIKE